MIRRRSAESVEMRCLSVADIDQLLTAIPQRYRAFVLTAA
jgi:hypothetical protein